MDFVVVLELWRRWLDEDVGRFAGEDMDALIAGVRWEVDVWDSGAVEESRRWVGEDWEGGEVGYLSMLACSFV